MLPATTTRVPEHTDKRINQQIQSRTLKNIEYFSTADRSAIDRRLKELDREWDIERALEINAATLALAGLGLGAFVSKKWLALPAVIAGFLWQHAAQGWCPPVPVLRRMGYRTPREIEIERHALKALRGDYKPISEIIGRGQPDPEHLMAVAEK
jgi:hypothetical protein